MGHAGGDVVYDLRGGGGVVRRGLPRAAVPLEAPHEAAVSGEVHLRAESGVLPSQPRLKVKSRSCAQCSIPAFIMSSKSHSFSLMSFL